MHTIPVPRPPTPRRTGRTPSDGPPSRSAHARRGSRGTPPLAAAALALFALACASSTTAPKNNGGGGDPSTGTLTVTITAPSGVTPTVTVTGPNAYAKTLTATQTLTGLAAGTYTITAGTGVTADSIVSIAYAGVVTGSPAAVTANATATSTVAYAEPWSSSGVLWVANTLGSTISGFTSTQLRASGSPTPTVTLGSNSYPSAIGGAVAIVIDQTGGMWNADDTDTLYYFTSAQIAHSTNSAAHTKIVSAALSQPIGLALDSHGNLWVADQDKGEIFEFTTAQMAVGGTLSPAVTLSAVLGSISRPVSLAFDSHGNLWVVNLNDSSVVGFSASAIQTSGSPAPYAALSRAPGATGAIGIAFDAQGDLWVASYTDTLAEFTPSQLTSIGSPTPAVTLTTPSIQEPGPIAFDNSGALWVGDVQRSKLFRYMPSQLTTSGSPTPAITISATGTSIEYPQGMAFSPHAPALPLN